MKNHFSFSLIILLLANLLWTGCGKEVYTGPDAVEPSQINSVLNESFADASDEVKEMVQDILIRYSKQQFVESSTILQGLCARQDITKVQRETASRCLITMSDEMNRAIAEKGDRRAEKFMQKRNALK
jgi:hypothetical protein